MILPSLGPTQPKSHCCEIAVFGMTDLVEDSRTGTTITDMSAMLGILLQSLYSVFLAD